MTLRHTEHRTSFHIYGIHECCHFYEISLSNLSFLVLIVGVLITLSGAAICCLVIVSSLNHYDDYLPYRTLLEASHEILHA
jgi:hypothetical protein